MSDNLVFGVPKKMTASVKREIKADETTRAVRAIVDKEATARELKTARLRAARMQAEAEAPIPMPKPKRRRAAGK